MVLDSDSLKLSIHDINTLCQHYLTILYHGMPQHTKHVSKNINETYGEILYPGIDKLLSAIELSKDDVFVDYGSGVGKIVIQVFLKSLVKEAYGIEISPELHQHAAHAAQKIQHDLPEFYNEGRKLIFLHGDFLKTPLTTSTVALVTSTCFTQPLLAELGKIIEGTPSIHTVLSLRPIHTLQRLSFKQAIRIECSWDTVLCYVYTLRT